jgi:transcriptional regulator with XRE-family HTH domain
MSLLDTQVTEIKQLLLENKLTQKQIGEQFGISRSLVSDIATNRSYKDIEPILQPRRIPGGQPKHMNIEQQNVALIGQIANLRDERNILKRQLKHAARRIAVVDSIVEQLSPVIRPIKPLKPIRGVTHKGQVQESMGLLLSDTHCDQVVTPDEVDGLENFNFPIAARRAEELVTSVLGWKERMTEFNFNTLEVLGLGDYSSGIIHGADKRSWYRDQFTNDLAIGQLFAQMLAELASHYQNVRVHSIVGNHGRLTDKIEFHKESVQANHDTLIMKIAQVHLKEVENIEWVFPTGLSAIVNIEGWPFLLHHGHGQKGASDIWARAKRKSQTLLPIHKGNLKYSCTGHFHTGGTSEAGGAFEMLGNGAFPATDQYAYQSLGVVGTPNQLSFGIHAPRGVTWRLPVHLRTEGEESGPQRYDIPERDV